MQHSHSIPPQHSFGFARPPAYLAPGALLRVSTPSEQVNCAPAASPPQADARSRAAGGWGTGSDAAMMGSVPVLRAHYGTITGETKIKDL